MYAPVCMCAYEDTQAYTPLENNLKGREESRDGDLLPSG